MTVIVPLQFILGYILLFLHYQEEDLKKDQKRLNFFTTPILFVQSLKKEQAIMERVENPWGEGKNYNLYESP